MHFEGSPKLPKSEPMALGKNNGGDETLSDPWFTETEAAPKKPEGVLDRVRRMLSEHTQVATAFTAATVIATACSSRLFETQSTSDATGSEATAVVLPNQVEISEAGGDLLIMLGGEHSIRITEWENRQQWDKDLVPETGNPTFAWHRKVLEKQYTDSFDPKASTIGIDPLYMKADEYPSFASIYGNMEIGNKEMVTATFIDAWLEAANSELGKKFNNQSDLSELTAAEWMYVLQAPIHITYDERLASVFPSYDKELAVRHWEKNIEQLLKEGTGVCRDNERLAVTSYIIANELFDLADNGLLYLPMINVVDAKHTRGAFYLSINPIDMLVVGIDITYGNGAIENSFAAVSQREVAIWHSQQYDKDRIFSPKEKLAAFKLFRDYPEMTIPPTAEAILYRQELQAKIDLFNSTSNQEEKKRLIKELYQDLLARVAKDATIAPFPLNLPSRLVDLYDVLITLAQKHDTLHGTGGANEATAKSHFQRYLSDNGVNPEEARSLTHTIDRLPTDERLERLLKIQSILEKNPPAK